MEDADEVMISVAYIKVAGLKKIEPYIRKGIRFEIITGLDFGITDPRALETIRSLCYGYNMAGYVHKIGSKISFHPKMYLVRCGSKGHIIIGSANLTAGGLQTNVECSMWYSCSVSEQIWKQAVVQFREGISCQRADPLSDHIISEYKKFHARQKSKREALVEFPGSEINVAYDFGWLSDRFRQMDRPAFDRACREKRQNYRRARETLDAIADRKHSDARFRELLEDLVGRSGEPGWWHSSGMSRRKSGIFREQDKFRSLVALIRKNIDKSPAQIYDGARKIIRDIHGAGPNYIGEIMASYAPDRLANINQNPITVLRERAGADIGGYSNSYNGFEYERFLHIIHALVGELGMRDMLEVDYFLSHFRGK